MSTNETLDHMLNETISAVHSIVEHSMDQDNKWMMVSYVLGGILIWFNTKVYKWVQFLHQQDEE